MAKPYIGKGIIQPWREHIEELAAFPNVWCKISGLVTEADHRRWEYEEFVPYLDTVHRAFGSGRIMVGSDWPVCMLAGSYREVLEIPLRYIRDLGEQDRTRICRQNAIDCYQLEDRA
jgi:L-fuconolactonase